jgi:ABC-2 type transport system permease protein
MMRTLRIYPALLRAHWHRTLIYRAAFVVWVVNAAFPLVMMSIWVGLAQGGDIGGYSAAGFAGYYLAAVLVRRITAISVVRELEDLVRTGELSTYLLKPISLVHHFVARVLTSRFLNLPIVAVPVILSLLLIPGIRLDLRPASLLLFGAACILGLVFEFLTQFAIGGLSFWIVQAHGVTAAYNLAQSFLGGYIVPLALFPLAVQGILHLLPFQSSVALPVEILTGRAPPEEALLRIAICVAWSVLMALLGRLLWQAGLRSYSAVGA